ncbi:MAG: hypothetical protein H7Z41_08100, partial [Cytophagales bacterium]|nr:hypothetical protein [Armatimonadota bacterium]
GSGAVVVGTFVSGAFRSTAGSDASWQAVAGTETDCVTGTSVAGDTVLISLRRGGTRSLVLSPGRSKTTAVSALPETQCLLPDPDNGLLWIGTRTGVVAVRLTPPSPRKAYTEGRPAPAPGPPL